MKVAEIQRFCMRDGPGVRTVVFLQGCPLSCIWCHNPEMRAREGEILFYPKKCVDCGACVAVCPAGAQKRGRERAFDRARCTGCGRCAAVCCAGALQSSCKEMRIEEIVAEVEKDRAFYGKEGGVTLSGGEPLLHAVEALALLRACKKRAIGTAIETSGCFDARILRELAATTDLALWDFKDGNDRRHKRNVGVSHAGIVENLLAADALGVRTVLRCIMVKGVNLQPDHYEAIAGLFRRLRHCLYVELLPYHTFGDAKAEAMGEKPSQKEACVPGEEDLAAAADYLSERGVIVKRNGSVIGR